MTDFTPKYRAASGLTGFVQRSLGISPLIAAAIKYGVLVGVAFGAYKVWEYNVRKDERTDIMVDAQAETIEDQSEAAEIAVEDRGALADGNQQSRDDERSNLTEAAVSLARQLEEERKAHEALKKAVRDNPCLAVDWPAELRVLGGRPIARAGENGSADP